MGNHQGKEATVRIPRVPAVACAAVLGLLLLGPGSVAVAKKKAPRATRQASVTTVVSGLDNPRDLAFAPNGRLYVAEAGHGGAECISGGEMGTACIGFTSAISRIDLHAGTSRQVVTGWPSLADETGAFATGIDGISFQGTGKLYGIVTASRDEVPPGLSAATTTRLQQQLGRLFRATPSGKVKVVGDVGHADFVWTSEHADLVPGQFPETNPYAVLGVSGGAWVVDAAANTIDWVSKQGTVEVRAFIPNPAVSDAVPTCIDRGPDGALYVGELSGGGNPPGSSRVWRFDPATGALTQWASGLTAVTGCGFGRDGRFYATELSTLGLEDAAPGTGAVVRVAPGSTSPEVVAEGLNFPGGFAAGRDGSLYVSNWSVAPAGGGDFPPGEVVRIVP
jgi:hypothetical protein